LKQKIDHSCQKANKTAKEEEMNERKPLKIIFISDSGIGKLVEDELRDDHPGDTVFEAADPEICKTMLRANKYDLLITGGRIQEQGKTGLELTRFAKDNCPDTKIIFMSSWTDAKEALAAGADRHWRGSSQIIELIKIIKELFPD
jgi:CheY-like chemotaxis protein